jgi:hypothetical protein
MDNAFYSPFISPEELYEWGSYMALSKVEKEQMIWKYRAKGGKGRNGPDPRSHQH